MPINKIDKKKDGLQGYRVRINWTDSSGKAHQVERTAYGKAEAQAMELKLKAEIKTEGSVRITLSQLWEEYFTVHAHEVRASTINKTQQHFRLHILPKLGKIRIDRISTAVLQKWKQSINNKNISLTYKKNIYTSFVSVLNYAVKMEYIVKNPLRSVGTFKDAEIVLKSDKLHYYTGEQFLKYISGAFESAKSGTDYACCVFFCIAFFTGMRKGEINAIKWSDIDGDIIRIRRSINMKTTPPTETATKNKSSMRDIIAPEPLKAVLSEQRKRQEDLPGFSTEWRVCGGEQPIADTTIDVHNRKYAANAELPHIRVHDFRHSHASLLVNEGINIQEIARRLGHSNIEITWNTYSHLYPREEERAIKILNKFGDFSGA